MRIYYLDYAKAIGILAIVMSHCFAFFPELKWLHYALCSFHVPIFFVVSGMISAQFPEKYEIDTLTFVKKRFRALIIPYIFFSLFNTILKLSVLFATQKLTLEIFNAEMEELFITGNGTVWFLVTLFFAEFLFFVIRRYKSDMVNITSMLILFGLCFFIGSTSNPLVVVLLRILCAYPLIVIGYYFLKPVNSLSMLSKFIWGGISLGLWIILLVNFHYRYSFFGAQFETPLISIFVMLTASFGIILLLSVIKKKINWLEYLGKNSLLYMLIHPTILLFYIYFLAGKFQMSSITQYLVATGLFIFIILACIPIIWLINNKLPFLIGRSNKFKNKNNSK